VGASGWRAQGRPVLCRYRFLGSPVRIEPCFIGPKRIEVCLSCRMAASDIQDRSDGNYVIRLQRLFAWFTTRRGSLFVVIGLTLFGLGLRLWRLDSEPMHVDELLQAGHVSAGWGELAGLAYRYDATPLDYFIGKLAVTIGPTTDFTQRLPAVVFGAATIGVVGTMVIRSGHRLGGVLAAAFIAVSPFLVRMSQFARPYALPVFFVAVTLAIYQHWSLGGKTRRTAVWFSGVGALAIISRPTMPVLALAVLGLLSLSIGLIRDGLHPKRLVQRDPLALGVLPALFLFVWVPNLLMMRASGSGGWLVDCWQCDKWDRLATGVERFGELGEVTMRPLSLNLLLFLSAALLIFPSVRRELGATKSIWAPLVITAPAFALVHALALRPGLLFVDRYLVFLPIGMAVYFAIALSGLLHSSRLLAQPGKLLVRMTVLISVVLALNAMLSEAVAQTEGTYLADWRSVADHIEAVEILGDLIVTIDTRPFEDDFRFGFTIASDRYYDGSLEYVVPDELIRSPALGLDAGRYHFILFVPRLAETWDFPDSWTISNYSQMLVVSTSDLASPSDRIDAWWELTQQLRPDVAVRSQIAGAALEIAGGVEIYPWIETAMREASRLGEESYAQTLISEIPTG
jgi:4-amino-4-deoxy-L-arabinose transferase-like glycosyltransferase